MKIAILMPFTWIARCSSSLLSAVATFSAFVADLAAVAGVVLTLVALPIDGVDIEFPPLG
jgi:hypothetical protein